MKNKKLIFSLIAFLFCLVMIVPMVTTVFVYRIDGGDPISEFGLFADYSSMESRYELIDETFHSFWATLVDISVVATIAVGVLFIVFTMLQMAQKNKIWTMSRKITSWLLALFFVTLLVGMVMFTLVNVVKIEADLILHIEIIWSMDMEPVGFIALGASLLATIFALLSTQKEKSKKKHK